MNLKCQFFSKVVIGGFNSSLIIECIDDFVKTIIVLDNASIHKSKAFKQKIKQWQEDDLYIYFLPPYSPELNKIEILWRFIKYKWIPFDAFLNFEKLKDRISEVLYNVGNKCSINFH